jgi:hypothetical protein
VFVIRFCEWLHVEVIVALGGGDRRQEIGDSNRLPGGAGVLAEMMNAE